MSHWHPHQCHKHHIVVDVLVKVFKGLYFLHGLVELCPPIRAQRGVRCSHIVFWFRLDLSATYN